MLATRVIFVFIKKFWVSERLQFGIWYYAFIQCLVVLLKLDMLTTMWNTYTLSSSSSIPWEGNRPLMLYTLPELYGFENQFCSDDAHEVVPCEEETTPKQYHPCDETVMIISNYIMKNIQNILYKIKPRALSGKSGRIRGSFKKYVDFFHNFCSRRFITLRFGTHIWTTNSVELK